MIAELPPILSGAPEQQLVALRDYLVRLAQSLETVSEAAVVEARQAAAEVSPAKEAIQEEVRETEGALRSLIIKTADVIQQNIDSITTELHQDYLAISTFGEYQENINTTIVQTARNTVEEYDFEAQIRSLNESITTINGEIIRGFVEDPTTGNIVMGIAIAQTLSYSETDTETDANKNVYYKIADQQTFGLYTSTGWQFWLKGTKIGWFDSLYQMLHTVKLAVETSLTLGDGWVFTTTGGLGIKYTGT